MKIQKECAINLFYNLTDVSVLGRCTLLNKL